MNRQRDFFKDSGLNVERTMEEEYIHSVNILESQGINLKGIYDHRNYVECSKVMHNKNYHSGESKRLVESELNVPNIMGIGLVVVSISLAILKFGGIL